MSEDAVSRGVAVVAVELTIGAPLVRDPAWAAAVAQDWAATAAANPRLWNGSFFLFEDVVLEPGKQFAATARPTDFATFLHWRRPAEPDDRFMHVFPVAAVTTADGRLLVGVQSGTTANPGRAYPPSGSFDDDDRSADGRLDPIANMVRELAEEVGLDAATLTAEPGFTVIASGPRRRALVKRWRTSARAAELAPRLSAHVAADAHGELSAVRFLGFDERLAEAEGVPYVNRLLALLAAEAERERSRTTAVGV